MNLLYSQSSLSLEPFKTLGARFHTGGHKCLILTLPSRQKRRRAALAAFQLMKIIDVSNARRSRCAWTGYLIRIAGSPNRIHERRTSLSATADLAFNAASPTVNKAGPNSS